METFEMWNQTALFAQQTHFKDTVQHTEAIDLNSSPSSLFLIINYVSRTISTSATTEQNIDDWILVPSMQTLLNQQSFIAGIQLSFHNK